MLKFEQIGVNFQYDAQTPAQAMKSFNYSCQCCCCKGMRINCDRCAIAQANAMVMACFADKKRKKGNDE